jgi:hypothetical protein
LKVEAGHETRPIALVTILNSIRSKSQIECAVHGVALKLVVEEGSGNTRSSSRDFDVVASDKRIGDTKHALIRAIQPDDGVIGHDAVININRTVETPNMLFQLPKSRAFVCRWRLWEGEKAEIRVCSRSAGCDD